MGGAKRSSTLGASRDSSSVRCYFTENQKESITMFEFMGLFQLILAAMVQPSTQNNNQTGRHEPVIIIVD